MSSCIHDLANIVSASAMLSLAVQRTPQMAIVSCSVMLSRTHGFCSKASYTSGCRYATAISSSAASRSESSTPSAIQGSCLISSACFCLFRSSQALCFRSAKDLSGVVRRVGGDVVGAGVRVGVGAGVDVGEGGVGVLVGGGVGVGVAVGSGVGVLVGNNGVWVGSGVKEGVCVAIGAGVGASVGDGAEVDNTATAVGAGAAVGTASGSGEVHPATAKASVRVIAAGAAREVKTRRTIIAAVFCFLNRAYLYAGCNSRAARRLVYASPPFMMSSRRSRSRRTEMFRSGSPSTTSTSACLPTSMVPTSLPMPQHSAA